MHILGSHTKIWGKKGQSVLTPIVVIENMENSMNFHSIKMSPKALKKIRTSKMFHVSIQGWLRLKVEVVPIKNVSFWLIGGGSTLY